MGGNVEKNNTKEKLYITIGGKEYLLRNNEYFVNMAMHSLQKIDELLILVPVI